MQIAHRTDLDALHHAAKTLAVLSAWSKTGCLQALAEGPRSLQSLPGDLRALRMSAPLLAHVGVLMGQGDTWALTPNARALLDQGLLELGHTLDFLDELGRTDQVLTEGGPVRDRHGVPRGTDIGVRRDNPAATRAFMDLLYNRAEDAAAFTAEWLHQRLPPGAAVLDLGGGHGRYGRSLADLGHQVTLLDVPAVVPLARERHGEALRYLQADFHTDDLAGPWDAVLLSNIAHGLSDADNLRLLRRVHAAMAPGGWLVVKDMFLDDTGTGPTVGVDFQLTMLFYTSEGRCQRLGEFRAWCLEAGFSAFDSVVVPAAVLAFARA